MLSVGEELTKVLKTHGESEGQVVGYNQTKRCWYFQTDRKAEEA